ncbi:hypothetical protein NGRA_0538 [Nosema granulosis]|uniref:Uncharacterized protein n=1 Tax=Nosema granulosis TaxID=83296 RepID=A0A9P6KZH1_9MICR|nr:hypothetical protein NGRA_0538 [Nosema granulosis]
MFFENENKTLTNERTEDILNDFSKDKSIDKLLKRLKSTSYELYDFVRLNTLLTNEDITSVLDDLCYIVLRGINFNLYFYIHKHSIHEKQNIRINPMNMDEDVEFPVLKEALKREIRKVNLVEDIKDIRLFVTYLILCNSELSRGSIVPPADYEYSGSLGLFYFLEYLITGNSEILTRWVLNGCVECNWCVLGLPPMDRFIMNEIRFVKDVSFVYSLILKSKSHDILSRFLVKILYRLSFSHTLHVLVVSSYNPTKTSDTVELLRRLDKEDKYKTRNILRDLIVEYKPEELRPVFLNYSESIKKYSFKNYIECLRVYLSEISNLSPQQLYEVVNSEYFYILLENKDDFYCVIRVIKDRGEKSLFGDTLVKLQKMKWEPTEDNIDKFIYLFSQFEIENDMFSDQITGLIEEIVKNSRKLKQELEKSSSFKIDNETIGSLKTVGDTKGSIKDITGNTTIGNETIGSLKTVGDTKGSIKDITGNTISPSNITTFTTLDEVKKLGKSNKKYKIKKKPKQIISEQTINKLIDLLFVLRNENLDFKKVYKLCPTGFLKRLENHQSENLDVFYIKAMNLAMAENLFVKLPFLKKNDDYWTIAVKKNLKSTKRKNSSIYNSSMYNSNMYNSSMYNSSMYNSNVCYNTALADFYLDISMINDSKIMLFDQSNQIQYNEQENKHYNEQENEQYNLLDEYTYKKIPPGLSMRNSSISISESLHSFTLCTKIYQFNTTGVQYLVEILSSKKVIRIGTMNGKLFHETTTTTTERKLLEHEVSYREYVYLEASYNGRSLRLSMESKDYSFSIGQVEGIVLGRDLKGVINKILLFESTGIKNCRISNLNGSYLYIKVLHKIERYLKYNNLKGVYMDDINPYYFNGKMALKFKNVL